MSDDLEALGVLHTEVVDDTPFFAPVSTDLVDSLIGQYEQLRQRIETIGALVGDEMHSGVVRYFIEGNVDESRGGLSLQKGAEQLFAVKGAVAALNAAYWSKALAFTDLLNIMPQKRRDEWNKAILERTTMEFSENAVRSTLIDLLNRRPQYLAERVDGIFQGLSGTHVTNSPEGFGKRMIFSGVMSSYRATGQISAAGLVNDLRCVVAKFMGRDEPQYQHSHALIETLRNNWGQWVTLDGGALRIRVYKVGTAHLEVHPDMAWRLNSVLAHMHPLAIPAQFRQRPKKRAKEFVMMGRPLPFAVLDLLAGMRPAAVRVGPGSLERYERVPNSRQMDRSRSGTKATWAEAEAVLEAIGGIRQSGYWLFDYEPGKVLDEIVASGCVPDVKAHQFYPTPRALAMRVVEAASIGPDDLVLEPSAGQGGLADFLPEDRTLCIEVAELNAKVLAAKGHNVTRADFLAWASTAAQRFDRVVMNPPFSEGRARLHVEAAAGLLRPGGRLVAIMPASHIGKVELAGCTCTWSQPIESAFPGVSVTVAMLTATREAA